METNDIRSTAIEFAKFCIKSIGLEVADATLQNDFDKFITKQKLPIHSVMQGLPKLSQPDRDELLDELLKVFYKQGFEIIPPKEVDFSKFIGKSLFRKQGSPTVGREGEKPQE